MIEKKNFFITLLSVNGDRALFHTAKTAKMIKVLPFDSPFAISYWWSFGTKPLSLTVSKISNVKCNAMVNVTLIRPLNTGQGHSFWYQSISHIRLLIGSQ